MNKDKLRERIKQFRVDIEDILGETIEQFLESVSHLSEEERNDLMENHPIFIDKNLQKGMFLALLFSSDKHKD